MKKIYQIFLLFILLVSPVLGYSQVEMADNFRGEGKIYVVLIIILLLLVGFFFLLFRLDKKSKQLEKEVEEHLNK